MSLPSIRMRQLLRVANKIVLCSVLCLVCRRSSAQIWINLTPQTYGSTSSTTTPFGLTGITTPTQGATGAEYFGIAQYNAAHYGNLALLGAYTSYSLSSIVNFTISSTGSGTFYAQGKTEVGLWQPQSATGANSNFPPLVTTVATYNIGSATSPISITSTTPDSGTSGVITGSGSSFVTTGLSTYTGSGTIYYDIGGWSGNTVTEVSGNAQGSWQNYASATLIVSYEIAPEPSAGTFVAAGFLALAFAAMRRRNRALRCVSV